MSSRTEKSDMRSAGYSDKEIDEILDLKRLVKGGYALTSSKS
ncbi:MAG: hypothetical protein ACP5FU_06305 [Nitrososphaeria archaeon]